MIKPWIRYRIRDFLVDYSIPIIGAVLLGLVVWTQNDRIQTLKEMMELADRQVDTCIEAFCSDNERHDFINGERCISVKPEHHACYACRESQL